MKYTFLLFILSLITSSTFGDVKSMSTKRQNKDDPEKQKKSSLKISYLTKSSSDSLSFILFGISPTLDLNNSAKVNKKRSTKSKFSFKMTDKVKTKSAFY